MHGARLDVYLEEPDKNAPGGAIVYDVEPDLSYDDGACTLYLHTKGTKGNPPEELRQLLHYMENTTEENATNNALQNIDQMVQRVKADGEVSLEYMKIFEREEMLVRKGQELERRNTERERQNAEREKMRADAAEREVERLKEELNELRRERS